MNSTPPFFFWRRAWLLAIATAMVLSAFSRADSAERLLVRNGLFLTMEPGQEDVFVGYMTVGADGRISALAAGEPPAGTTAETVVDASGKFVAPGFISAHSHLAFSPLRGVGHTETLYGWIRASMRYLSRTDPDDLYWFTLHGSLSFIRDGITTAYDFTTGAPTVSSGTSLIPAIGSTVVPAQLQPGPYQENQIRAKADAGLRFINSVGVPRGWAPAAAEQWFVELMDWARKNYGDNPLYVKMALSGAQQWGPTPETARFEAYMMKKYDLLNESHFLESPDNVPEQQSKFDWYVESGALGPNFIFGHFIQTTPRIAAIAAASGASMSWQPASNSRLASGVADIPLYRALGMKVGVGLDNQNCTDTSDPFQNLRIGLALIRTKYKDAKAMSVYDMLFLHTLGSAEILHIEKDVGSLAPGKLADFLIVDPRDPDTGPLHDPVATYVLACGQRNLKQVYIGGRLAADGTRLTTFDEEQCKREVDARIERIRAQIRAEETATTSAP